MVETIDNANALKNILSEPTSKLRQLTDIRASDTAGESKTVQLEKLIDSDKVLSKISGIEISISLDDTSIPPVVRIFDRSTGEELVQIPTSTSIAIRRSVDQLLGLVFDKRA